MEKAKKNTKKKRRKGKGEDIGKSKEKSKEKEVKLGEIEFDWGKKHAAYGKKHYSLKADIIHQFPEHHVPFDVFSVLTNLDELGKFLVNKNNLYAQQNGREFYFKKQEKKAFLGINHIVSINKQ